MKTLLQIVQSVCRDVGQPRPSVVVSATDETPLRMLRLLNEAGRTLSKDHDWQALTTVTSFTAIAAQAQTGHPPSDFDRFTSQTQLWDTGLKRPCVGPLPMDKWLEVIASDIDGIDKYWTMLSGLINIQPVPAASDTFLYSYQSSNWVYASDGTTGKEEFTSDDDTPRFSDELLIRELTWRWKQAIGIDYAEDMASAARFKEVVIAADRGPRILNLARPIRRDLPDNFWPGTITS